MIDFTNIMRIVVWALLIPFVLGMLPAGLCRENDRMLCKNFAYGFMLQAAVFQLLAVPMIKLQLPFHVLKNGWIGVILCLTALSLVLNYKEFGQNIKQRFSFEKPQGLTVLIWAAVVLLVLFQTWLLCGQMHIDTDDARFLSEALEAVEKDTMLQVHPITGEFLGNAYGEMTKDVSSPYPIFLGLLGALFGISPTIAAHLVLPALLIPLCYVVYYMIGCFFFDSDAKLTGLFLVFLSFIHLFSFESVYAPGYTLLTIIWQGRSVFAMIMLPLLWISLLKMTGSRKICAGEYIVLMLTMLACAMLSGMGVALSILLAGVYLCVTSYQKKSLLTALCMFLCICPNLVYLSLRFLL